MRYIQPLFEETLHLYAGRQGGEYSMAMLDTDKWEVRARIHLENNKDACVTFWRVGIRDGFEDAAKLLAYCVEHDANARFAAQQLYVQGDMEPMIALHTAASELDLHKQQRAVAVEHYQAEKLAHILAAFHEEGVYPADFRGWVHEAITILDKLNA